MWCESLDSFEQVEFAGPYYTYSQQLEKDIRPGVGAIRLREASTPLVDKNLMAIKTEVGTD
jgi:hypothetical protein